MNKDIGKLCEFHKIPAHNTSECQEKQSLVAKLKVSESYACSNFVSEPDKGNDKGNKIIDVEPSAIVTTTKIQKIEPADIEEGGEALPLTDVGEGLSIVVHCRQRKTK